MGWEQAGSWWLVVGLFVGQALQTKRQLRPQAVGKEASRTRWCTPQLTVGETAVGMPYTDVAAGA